eukprot:574044-Prymnesium_polylepis.1
MVGQRIGSRVAAEDVEAKRCGQRKGGGQQTVFAHIRGEIRMGSIQHAVCTGGPGRRRRHGPSFSCRGINALGKSEVRFSEKKRAIGEGGVLVG